MIMFGSNIQSSTDTLKKVQEEYIFNIIRNPKPQIATTVRQLRTVYAMDTRRYAQLKRQLPYFVCGQFVPPFRLSANFAFTESFVLDFDHLALKQLSLAEVRKEIISDSQVMMCFASPSEDGLKVMFHLKERCYDAGLYSIFYRAFANDFACRHNLTQVVDSKTCDITRACFISIDPQAYYNPSCEPVNQKTFIDTANPIAIFDMKRDLDKHDKIMSHDDETLHPKDPDQEILNQIRQKLNACSVPKHDAPLAFVPQLLEDIINDIKSFIEETGIVVTEIINIQYAKKIRAKIGLKEGEVNLFYGRKGFSVIISPRRGTNEELNELLAQLIKQFIATQ